MSIAYDISASSGATIVVWDGIVGAKEFLAHVHRLCSDPHWPPPMRRHITDLTSVSLDSSMSDLVIEEAAHVYGEQQQKLERMAVAIVALDEFEKAVTFEKVLLRYGANVIVFNHTDIACRWLGLSDKDVVSTLQRLRALARRV